MIRKIDGLVLDDLGSIAAFVQRYTGYDCLDLSTAALACGIILDLAANRFLWASGWTFVLAANIIFTQDEVREQTSKGFRNPRRIELSYLFYRFIWLIYALSSFVNAIGHSAIGICLFFFFSSCDPLPPCSGKIREWIKSALSAPRHLVTIREN